jgi:glucan phosphoethanolaminetransferase (alkaline phosphatase superfamily)
MISLIFNQLKKTPLVPAVIGVFGFISDILTPLAPFSSYLFFISAFLIVIIIIIMLVKTSLQEKIAPIFMVLVTLFILSGVLFALQENTNTDSKEYGVLASQIPALKTLQSSLGVIQEDVALINISTENIDKRLLELKNSSNKLK